LCRLLEKEAVAILHDESVLRQPAHARLLRVCGLDASDVTQSCGCFLPFCEVTRVVRWGRGVTSGRFGVPLPCVIFELSAFVRAGSERAVACSVAYVSARVRRLARGIRPSGWVWSAGGVR
jgi:hypothetical protein